MFIRWGRFFSLASTSLLLALLFQNCSGGFESFKTDLNSSARNSPLALAESKALAVISTNCNVCHGIQSLGNVSGITDSTHLLSSGLVVPGDPDTSPLYKAIAENRMPPGQALSAADKKIVSDWVLLLGGISPDGTPAIDMSFALTINTDPLAFRTRLAKVENLLGSPMSTSLIKIRSENIFLGDYDHSRGIIPKFSWEANDMMAWIQSVEPVCASPEFSSRFSWPAGAGNFIQAALGRDFSSNDNILVQDTNALSATNAEKFQVFCMAVLSSLEFVAR